MSTEAFPKPTITRYSPEFKQEAYASLPTIELVLFSVGILHADGSPVAVEEIVSTCFRLFPHSFALKNYFYWPDSALVTRRLHDAKEKKWLKGSPTEGFALTGRGKLIAKQIAKALGVTLPVPPRVEAVTPEPVAAPKVEEPVIAPPVVVVEKKEEEKKETTTQTPIAKKTIAKPKKKAEKKAAVKAAVKKPKPKIKVKAEKKPAQVEKPKAKAKAKTKLVEPAVAKAELPKPKAKPKETAAKEKPKPAPKAKTKKSNTQNAAPTQLTMSLAPPTAWKKAKAAATKPKVKEEAQQVVKGEVLTAVAVSKEEKEKAAKVIKQIERSDAYQLYKRNGRRAQIGEFDFRNLLFATMESSAETLKRNVELFKRYAGIHFRADLIAFLEFCEEHFAALLKTKEKKALRK
jgi:hypothetical protein